MRGVGLNADADGGQHPEIAPAPSERDRVVDRTAAGIQHDGRAAELPAAREFIEIPWSIGGHDTDRADPAPAIRLARDPAELHRQFASFEGDAGMRRTAQQGHQADQCDAKGGANEQHPSSGCLPNERDQRLDRRCGRAPRFRPRDCRQVDRERPARDQAAVPFVLGTIGLPHSTSTRWAAGCADPAPSGSSIRWRAASAWRWCPSWRSWRSTSACPRSAPPVWPWW